MFVRRLQYGVLLVGAAAYYISSGEWISWILLLVVAGLPWLSLLLSLPAMLSFRVAPAGVDTLEMGEEADLWLLGSCSSPMPPFRGRIRVQSLRSGEDWRYSSEDGLPTDHCGGYRARTENVKIYDYLGLFSFKVRRSQCQTVIIRPKPMAVEDLVDPQRLEIDRWIPKAGGGYSENHEHRLYRPGDSLNQLHWKLSAKVGDLILREPMEPVRGAVLLTLSLQGEPDELDRKFGRLLWVGRYLLDRDLDFEIRALSNKGVVTHHVDSESTLMKAIDTLLCTGQPDDSLNWDHAGDASWQYHIGGDPDEP